LEFGVSSNLVCVKQFRSTWAPPKKEQQMDDNIETPSRTKRMRPEDTFEPGVNAFAQAIFDWMHDRGYSREQAATKSDISFYTLTEVIGGARPSIATVVKLAKAGVEFDAKVVSTL
jgi:hypothetical protein